jgi:hypothetical protein
MKMRPEVKTAVEDILIELAPVLTPVLGKSLGIIIEELERLPAMEVSVLATTCGLAHSHGCSCPLLTALGKENQ